MFPLFLNKSYTYFTILAFKQLKYTGVIFFLRTHVWHTILPGIYRRGTLTTKWLSHNVILTNGLIQKVFWGHFQIS